ASGGDDCDDQNPQIFPGATELCDGVDNNCNGDIDDGLPPRALWYLDQDRDGYGIASVSELSCGAPSAAYADQSGDCDDTRTEISPDSVEVCGDGEDQDCDPSSPRCRLLGPLDAFSAYRILPGALNVGGDLSRRGDQILIGAANRGGPGSAYLLSVDDFDDVADAAELDDVAVRFRGDDPKGRFGMSSVSADLDGDGNSQVFVGAPGRDEVGMVYGFSDGIAPLQHLEDAALRLTGDSELGWFGAALSRLPLDDRDALLVGAPGWAAEMGAVYVYLNADDGPATTLMGDRLGGRLGSAIAEVGDVDGDGVSDVAVGAPGAAGQLLLISAAELDGAMKVLVPETAAFATIFGDAPDAALGDVVAAPGDLNRDGYADVLVGAPGRNESTGAVALLLGQADPGDREMSDADALLLGIAAGDRAGAAVSGGVPLRPGGGPEIAIGAPGALAVYLIHDVPQGIQSLETASTVISGTYADGFGSAITMLPDNPVNGEGLLLVGAPDRYGAVYFFLSPGE
ncbi:MAG: MopE-related protein, partial [Myxococcota bacterium]